MEVVCLIFARGGSKGLPGKNVRLLDGIPLIARSIIQSKKIHRIKRTIVSTDCENIAEIAKQYGAEVPFLRPSALATDSSPEWHSWQHAIKFLQTQQDNWNLEPVISLPATAPLRHDSDIEKCLDYYENNEVDAVITCTPAQRNPYFNMVKRNSNGYAELIIRSNSHIYRRQDAPQVYDLATVAYVADPQYVMKTQSILEGNVGLVEIPTVRALDIDTLLDFEIAEFLLKRTKNENA